MTITRNALRCLICLDVIESRFRHDFRNCSCGNAFIDGGLDYVRWGAHNPEQIELLTEKTDSQ